MGNGGSLMERSGILMKAARFEIFLPPLEPHYGSHWHSFCIEDWKVRRGSIEHRDQRPDRFCLRGDLLYFSLLWKIGCPLSPAFLLDSYPALRPCWNLHPDEHSTVNLSIGQRGRDRKWAHSTLG